MGPTNILTRPARLVLQVKTNQPLGLPPYRVQWLSGVNGLCWCFSHCCLKQTGSGRADVADCEP